MSIGFAAADADSSGGVSAPEMEKYLADRLEDDDLKHAAIFDRIDANDDDSISEEEFENRHGAITAEMGENYFGAGVPDFEDPGEGYVLHPGANKPTNDAKIMGAVLHRFEQLSDDESVTWLEDVDVDKVPATLDSVLQQQKPGDGKPSVDDVIKSTVIICGGGDMGFFTAGGVVISKDGLVVTNNHVAIALADGKMGAMTSDGKCHPVVEYLATNKDRDVALLRIKGSNFTHVNVAKSAPGIGSTLEMLHHSENRFYTYDRGYVMRYPVLGAHPWMEISADYAPGGSGCGIFNEKRELVGLVSIIQYGDGPMLAEELDMSADDEGFGDEGFGEEEGFGDEGEMGGGDMDAMLLMKHAVPLSAIRSLWKEPSISVEAIRDNKSR